MTSGRRATRGIVAGLCALGAVIAASRDARAGVDASRCPGLDARELSRLLTLEIASLSRSTEAIPPFDLSLTCTREGVHMALVDALTAKRLERSIPAPPPDEPGRERLLALAASQLLVASWLELLVVERPQPAAPTPAVRVAEKAANRAVARRDTRLEASVEGGVALRDLRAPIPFLHVGAQAGYWFAERWAGLVDLRFESGSASRTGGSIQARTASLGFGPAFRSARLGPLWFEARLTASLLYVHLEGRPESAKYIGRSTEGLTGDLALALGPAIALGPLHIDLAALGGLTLPVPEGSVVGDISVRLSGPWFGGALRIGVTRAGSP